MDLYQCFVLPNKVRAFAGGNSVCSDQKGGKFSLFGGNIEGENVEVIPEKKLVQKWRFKDWPKDYYSTVEINFEPKDGRTHLTLKHKDVIPSSKDLAKEGWQRNYFTGIKGCFGYGSINF